MKVQQFDKPNVRNIRDAISKALKAVEEEFGISITQAKTVTFDTESFPLRLNIAIGDASKTKQLGFSEVIPTHYKNMGIELNMTVIDNGKRLKLVGYNVRSTKNPFILEDGNGKRYSCHHAYLLSKLSK